MNGPTEPVAIRSVLGHWLLGLLGGAVAGLAPLALGTVGIVLAVPVAAWSLVDRPHGVALGAALVGIGATWLVVWSRAVRQCIGPGTASEGCVAPNLSGLLAVPIVVLVAGGLVSLVMALRLR